MVSTGVQLVHMGFRLFSDLHVHTCGAKHSWNRVLISEADKCLLCETLVNTRD